MWASLSPDGQQLASVGREATVSIYLASGTGTPLRLHGHEQAVFKAIFSPDSRQLATVSGDATVRLWDLDTQSELFRLRLPTKFDGSSPLWDFDFRCTPTGCWIAVPLTSGKLALYNLGKIKDYAAEEPANAEPPPPTAPVAPDAASLLQEEQRHQEAIKKNPQSADAFAAFAAFEYDRENYAAAEKRLKQALALDPKHIDGLSLYTVLLQYINKDYAKAEKYHRQLAPLVPNNPNILGNFAQVMLAQGKLEEGHDLINQSFANHAAKYHVSLLLELWFYRLAHFPDKYPYAKDKLIALLEKGARDEQWDFSGNIAQAEKAGHPDVALLKAIADVINNKAEFSTLTQYLEK